MDKNKTQALLPRECELDRLHLDVSTHDEAAGVGLGLHQPFSFG